MRDTKSVEAFTEAGKVLVGGVNSPVRAFGGVGGTPVFMASGQGSRVTDIDGNTYIDYLASWGPLILGHAAPEVVALSVLAAASGTPNATPTVALATRSETLKLSASLG